jgi:hypothetical protein
MTIEPRFLATLEEMKNAVIVDDPNSLVDDRQRLDKDQAIVILNLVERFNRNELDARALKTAIGDAMVTWDNATMSKTVANNIYIGLN